MIESEKKEFGAWWIWITLLIVVSIIAFSILGYFGKIGSVFVERKVFEQSYQRSEAMKSQEITWNAQLASINSQLISNPNSTSLIAQKRMLEVQIAQIKGMR